MSFFLKFIFIKKEVEELGSDIHIVWKKRSDELVLCHSLMVDSFHGSKSSFFHLSLSLWLYFFWVQNWIWFGIHMLDTGGVIKDYVWVLGLLWSLRTERTEHECVYTWISPLYCFLCYYYCLLLLCYAGSLSQSACAKLMLWLWWIFLYFNLRLKLLDF